MSSPAMSPDPRRPALILHHPSVSSRLVDPATGAEVDHAKAAQRKERMYAIATILAGFDDLSLRRLSSPERIHYVNAAGLAMDAAAGPRF